jgi:hypothetical protein
MALGGNGRVRRGVECLYGILEYHISIVVFRQRGRRESEKKEKEQRIGGQH